MISSHQFINRQLSNDTQEKWPYLSSKDYHNMASILQTFPHLKAINQEEFIQENNNVSGIVIRSANDDNVHKAIKYGIWTTTLKNKGKLQQLWNKKINNNTDTYLFFSVVKSGMFEGVARLVSGYHQGIFPYWWQNANLKFKGYFQIEWVYIKDINNKNFMGLSNVEGEQVIKSKDCDSLDSYTTLKMLNIFKQKKKKRWIFNDFAFMDERQFEYTRKIYQASKYYQANQVYNNYTANYQPYNQTNSKSYDLPSFIQPNPFQIQSSMIKPAIAPLSIPAALMKPGILQNPGSNHGFQMNPVSKNKKK